MLKRIISLYLDHKNDTKTFHPQVGWTPILKGCEFNIHCILECCTQKNKMCRCSVLLVKINYCRHEKNPGKYSIFCQAPSHLSIGDPPPQPPWKFCGGWWDNALCTSRYNLPVCVCGGGEGGSGGLSLGVHQQKLSSEWEICVQLYLTTCTVTVASIFLDGLI